MTRPALSLVPPGPEPEVIGSTVPGLVITADEPASLTVRHEASGTPIIEDLAGLATAEWAAEDLGRLGVDWRLSVPEIADVADLLCSVEPDVKRLAVKHDGRVPPKGAVYEL